MNSQSSLSLSEAQRIAVTAQGLGASAANPPTALSIIRQLGCIQIDAMQAPRRSQELVVLARGATGTAAASLTRERRPAETFETWGHAHSLMSVSLWPYLAWRRRSIRTRGWRGPAVDPVAVERVLAAIRDNGPQTLSQLDKATGSGWERESPSRWACEWSLSVGELACVGRDAKWKRYYALPETVLPSHILQTDFSDTECIRHLVHVALSAMGVATSADVADYFRMPLAAAESALREGEYETVSVAGGDQTWYLSGSVTDHEPSDIRITALSPLDSLIWTRPRQMMLFGKDYKLESYKPAARREFGYYGMPLLRGSRIIGRIAVRRRKTTLEVEALELDHGQPRDLMADLYAQLLEWSGCTRLETDPE